MPNKLFSNIASIYCFNGLFPLLDSDLDSDLDMDSCTMQHFSIGSDSDSDPLVEMHVIETEICPWGESNLSLKWVQYPFGNCCDIGQNMYRLRCQDDIFSRIELFLQSSCQVKRLITRMTFNSFLSCLMSKESMEITINTYKWHEHAKQWNGNSHVSS